MMIETIKPIHKKSINQRDKSAKSNKHRRQKPKVIIDILSKDLCISLGIYVPRISNRNFTFDFVYDRKFNTVSRRVVIRILDTAIEILILIFLRKLALF